MTVILFLNMQQQTYTRTRNTRIQCIAILTRSMVWKITDNLTMHEFQKTSLDQNREPARGDVESPCMCAGIHYYQQAAGLNRPRSHPFAAEHATTHTKSTQPRPPQQPQPQLQQQP